MNLYVGIECRLLKEQMICFNTIEHIFAFLIILQVLMG